MITDNESKVDSHYSYTTGDIQCYRCGGTDFIWEGTCKVCGNLYHKLWQDLRDQIQQMMWSPEQQGAIRNDHSILITPYTVLLKMEELEKGLVGSNKTEYKIELDINKVKITGFGLDPF